MSVRTVSFFLHSGLTLPSPTRFFPASVALKPTNSLATVGAVKTSTMQQFKGKMGWSAQHHSRSYHCLTYLAAHLKLHSRAYLSV